MAGRCHAHPTYAERCRNILHHRPGNAFIRPVLRSLPWDSERYPTERQMFWGSRIASEIVDEPARMVTGDGGMPAAYAVVAGLAAPERAGLLIRQP
jgi:hypothetical protein